MARVARQMVQRVPSPTLAATLSARRLLLEQIPRVIAMLALLWLTWLAFQPKPRAVARARTRDLDGALLQWSSAAAPAAAELELDAVPSPVQRDWARAIARAGTTLRWSGPHIRPAAVAVRPLALPRGGVQAFVSSLGSSAAVSDDIGLIDSLSGAKNGAGLLAREVHGSLRATVAGTRAIDAPRDSLRIGRVLVLGAVGWETKFVAATLEEDGWKVDSRQTVAPTANLTTVSTLPAAAPVAVRVQTVATVRPLISSGAPAHSAPTAQIAAPAPPAPPPPPLDTARYAAVVALDTTASSRVSEIARFVSAGGGVILGAAAARSPAFASLLVANAEPTIAGYDITTADTTPWLSLPIAPIAIPASEASISKAIPSPVVLERTARGAAVAARRLGYGRVLQLGYEETWRWRMQGGGSSVADYRRWLSMLVSNVAYAPSIALPPAVRDPVPYSDLVATLGSPVPHSRDTSVMARLASLGSLSWTMFALLGIAFIVEWASRRLRGAK